MTSTMNWPDAIEEYLRDQRQAGRINSPNTVRGCRRVLGRHAQDTPGGPLGAVREDVKRTLARWEHPNTRAGGHSVLVSFYDWMGTEGYRVDNPARQVARTKTRKQTTIRLTRREVDAMIAACETQRERWVILLGVCTGARVAELAAFQGRHFERPGFVWFSADIAKGKHERWVPVLPELAPVVEEIRATIPCSDHYVIATYKNSSRVPRPRTYQISRIALSRLIRGVARRAGITTRVHPHLLRHAFGDHVARHAGLRAAQALMGHASVQTTASVYVDRPDLEELAGSVEGLRYGAQNGAEAPETASLVAEFAQLADRSRPSLELEPEPAPVTYVARAASVLNAQPIMRIAAAPSTPGGFTLRLPVLPASRTVTQPQAPLTPLGEALDRKDVSRSAFADLIRVEQELVDQWVAGKATPAPAHCLHIAQVLDESVLVLWPGAMGPAHTDPPSSGS